MASKFRVGQTVRMRQYYAGIPIHQSGPVVKGPATCYMGGLSYCIEFTTYDEGEATSEVRWIPEAVLLEANFLEHLADLAAKEAASKN